ncbi:tetratricopeptide repeat-containing sensor histidine kinase [Portibacter lacus]|nr:histidine kinase [Portibacter lacus]
MFHKTLFLLSIFLFAFSKSMVAQVNVGLENKVEQYLAASNPNEAYEELSGLIEFNANVSLNEANYYLEKYNKDTYISEDKRYPLIAHFIAADVLYYNELKDSSLIQYLTLTAKAKDLGENMLAASGVGNAAFVLSELGDKVGALNLIKQNLTISRNTGDIRDLSDHTYNLASMYADLGMRDSSIVYFEKTLEIDRNSENHHGMIYNMQMLMEQYLLSGNYETVLSLCEECILISQEVENKKSEPKCYYYQALTQLEMNQFLAARKSIEQAILLDEKRSDPTRLSKYFLVYANVLAKLNEHNEAIKYYQMAIESGEKNQEQTDIVAACLEYGLYSGNVEWLEKAELIIDNAKLESYRQELYQNYARLNADKGLYELAYGYQKKEAELLENYNKDQGLQVTEQSKNAYDLFVKENENRNLQIEKELSEAKSKRRQNQLIFSLLVLGLLATLVWFAYRNQKQKNLLLEQKKKEEAIGFELQVMEKELTALRSQMNPHFLFNSLNSINDYIIHEEPRLASKYLTKFSQLMRTILNNSKEKMITLREELNALELYVEMENLRFKEKFDFGLKVDQKLNLDNIKIPTMLLQPYVENAIKHGLRNKRESGNLEIWVRQEDGELKIDITDNGVGRKEAMRLKNHKDRARKSHGMDITSDRIDLLNRIHDIDAQVQIIDLENGGGTRVEVRMKV